MPRFKIFIELLVNFTLRADFAGHKDRSARVHWNDLNIWDDLDSSVSKQKGISASDRNKYPRMTFLTSAFHYFRRRIQRDFCVVHFVQFTWLKVATLFADEFCNASRI